jgi:SAM-dependent methyltransferase
MAEIRASPYLATAGRVRVAYQFFGDVYDPLIHLSFPGYARSVAETYLEHIPRSLAGPVVEVGPGTGLLTQALAGACPGRRIIGVDLSMKMLRIARGRTGPSVDWLVGDACEGIPLQSGAAAVVVCQYTFGHLESPQRAFNEMRRVLRRGGVLMLGAVVARGAARLGRWLNGTRGLDPEVTCGVLGESGFADVSWAPFRGRSRSMRRRFVLVRAVAA